MLFNRQSQQIEFARDLLTTMFGKQHAEMGGLFSAVARQGPGAVLLSPVRLPNATGHGSQDLFSPFRPSHEVVGLPAFQQHQRDFAPDANESRAPWVVASHEHSSDFARARPTDGNDDDFVQEAAQTLLQMSTTILKRKRSDEDLLSQAAKRQDRSATPPRLEISNQTFGYQRAPQPPQLDVGAPSVTNHTGTYPFNVPTETAPAGNRGGTAPAVHGSAPAETHPKSGPSAATTSAGQGTAATGLRPENEPPVQTAAVVQGTDSTAGTITAGQDDAPADADRTGIPTGTASTNTQVLSNSYNTDSEDSREIILVGTPSRQVIRRAPYESSPFRLQVRELACAENMSLEDAATMVLREQQYNMAYHQSMYKQAQLIPKQDQHEDNWEQREDHQDSNQQNTERRLAHDAWNETANVTCARGTGFSLSLVVLQVFHLIQGFLDNPCPCLEQCSPSRLNMISRWVFGSDTAPCVIVQIGLVLLLILYVRLISALPSWLFMFISAVVLVFTFAKLVTAIASTLMWISVGLLTIIPAVAVWHNGNLLDDLLDDALSADEMKVARKQFKKQVKRICYFQIAVLLISSALIWWLTE